MYEIIDNKGVIYSGENLAEMENVYNAMINKDDEYIDDDWQGDLKLVHVLRVER